MEFLHSLQPPIKALNFSKVQNSLPHLKFWCLLHCQTIPLLNFGVCDTHSIWYLTLCSSINWKEVRGTREGASIFVSLTIKGRECFCHVLLFNKISLGLFQGPLRDLWGTFEGPLRDLWGTIEGPSGTFRNLWGTFMDLLRIFRDLEGILRDLSGTFRNLQESFRDF